MDSNGKDAGANNRGKRAPQAGSGEVVGSGAGAGAGGNSEDFDSDATAGGGKLSIDNPDAPKNGADAPVHGSR